jgi:hypothetical protein
MELKNNKDNLEKTDKNKIIKVVFEEDFLRIYWMDKRGTKKVPKIRLASFAALHSLVKKNIQ